MTLSLFSMLHLHSSVLNTGTDKGNGIELKDLLNATIDNCNNKYTSTVQHAFRAQKVDMLHLNPLLKCFYVRWATHHPQRHHHKPCIWQDWWGLLGAAVLEKSSSSGCKP